MPCISCECVGLIRSNAATIKTEEGMPCISCECMGLIRSNAPTIRKRDICIVSRMSEWKCLDRMLQQSERGTYALYLV